MMTENPPIRAWRHQSAIVLIDSAGLSLLSEEYGRALLGDRTNAALAAHELAHQWWGNTVTCVAWTHFWLNEGFATFMAATYLEHRFGTASYDRVVDGWRTRYAQLVADGRDRRLVFAEWIRPTADDRALVYQKGALVLHELRRLLGEQVFWTAIRRYTREFAGQSVSTREFFESVSKTSGRDLASFVDRWR